jgi:N-methylhydantoinase B
MIGAWSSIRLSDMIVRAFAEALPAEIPASNGGDLVQLLAYIRRHRSESMSFFGELGALGHGARAGADGMNALIHPMEAGAQNIPIELIESRMPVIKRRYELIVDSGGPGQYRGGLSAETEIEFTGEGTAVVVAERTRAEIVPGVAGGSPAPFQNSVILYPGTDRELRLGKRSELLIRPGDRAIVRPAGGGGWGIPWERDPATVAADVRGGYVSRAEAERVYGVVIDDAGDVDWPATAARRAEAPPRRTGIEGD